MFGGGGEGYGLKKGSSYMHIVVWKTQSKISAIYVRKTKSKMGWASQHIFSMTVGEEISKLLFL